MFGKKKKANAGRRGKPIPPAIGIMKRHNPKARVGVLPNGHVVGLEDVRDPDGRTYRLKYYATPDGARANAFVVHNPWSTHAADVQAGESYPVAHVASNGWICVSTRASKRLEDSPHNLAFVIARARYWVTAFSHLKQHGTFPHPGSGGAI